MGNPTDSKIIRADKALRRKVIVFFVLLAALAWFLLDRSIEYLHYLDELTKQDPGAALEKADLVLRLLPLLAGGIFVAIGARGIYLGRKVVKAGRIPLPGKKVLRDTVVITGAAAKRRGLMVIIASLFCVAFGVGGTWYLYPKSRSVEFKFMRSGEVSGFTHLIISSNRHRATEVTEKTMGSSLCSLSLRGEITRLG